MTEIPDRGSGTGFVVRRMVAAFGAGSLSADALEGAVELAERLGAELEMLFVEDLALLQWAELPFMRQISLLGLSAPPLSRQDLELQFRALAIEAQRRLSSAAAPRRLRWSFRIARGQVSGELVAAAAHTDLLVLGSSSRPVVRGALLEPSVRSLIGIVRAPVLLVRPEQPPGGPVHVVLEASGTAMRLLDAARALAGSYPYSARVTVWIADAPLGHKLEDELAGAAPGAQVRRFSASAGGEPLIRAAVGGTLVLSATSSLVGLTTWWRHLSAARCTVLFVP